MTHRNPVGHGDRRELTRRAARRRNAFLCRLRLARQGDVARRRLVPGCCDADQRLVDLLLGKPHRVEKRAMRRPLWSDRDMPARQARFVESGSANVVRHESAPVGGDEAGTVPPPPDAINAARCGSYPQRGCSPRLTPSVVLPTISCTRKVLAGWKRPQRASRNSRSSSFPRKMPEPPETDIALSTIRQHASTA